jgi:MFS family permease
MPLSHWKATTPSLVESALASDRATAMAEWKVGWPLVLACAIGFSMAAVNNNTIGLFMEPLKNEFGWNRSQITFGLTINAVASTLLSPVVGAMVDRWGSRWLALPGLALAAVGIACLGLVNSLAQWTMVWCFYALVSMGVKLTVWTTATSKSFTTSRGLAIATVIAGGGISGVFAPPLAHWLIEGFGWRQAYVYLALIWGLPSLLLAVFCMYERGRGPQRVSADEPSVPMESMSGLSMAEALRDWSLGRIALSTLLFIFFSGTMLIHQIPIMIEAGMTTGTAALIASLSAVAAFIGKFVTGVLMDRMHAAKLAGITIAFCAFAFLLLIEPLRTHATIVISILLIGFTGGAKLQVTAYLTGRYGGLRNFGKIFGLMSSVIAIAAGIGPLGASALYDLTGSYSPYIIAAIPGCLISGVLIYSLGAYPNWDSDAHLDRRLAAI